MGLTGPTSSSHIMLKKGKVPNEELTVDALIAVIEHLESIEKKLADIKGKL